AALVTTGGEIRVAQNFTADADLLDDAFIKLRERSGPNRIVDGVNRACDLLEARKERARRVILLISEARDEGSKAHFRDAVLRAQKENIVIYSISYSAYTTPFTQRAGDKPAAPDEPGSYDPENHGGVNLLAIPMALA